MPLYNYLCPKGHCFEAINPMENRAFAKCDECGKMAKQTVSRRPAAVHGFKLGWFEHISADPVYAKSKRHLRELLNQNDSYAPGVLD